MSDKARIKIAAFVTMVFLAGLSAAGLASRKHEPASRAAPAPATTAVQQRAVPRPGDVVPDHGDDDYENEAHEEHEDDG